MKFMHNKETCDALFTFMYEKQATLEMRVSNPLSHEDNIGVRLTWKEGNSEHGLLVSVREEYLETLLLKLGMEVQRKQYASGQVSNMPLLPE